MNRAERVALADMVIGPVRRERLIARHADKLALTHGMSLPAARRYATVLYGEGAAELIVQAGQIWRSDEGGTVPGASFRPGKDPGQVEVHGRPSGGMADIGGGSLINLRYFETDMTLVAWPESYDLTDPEPAAPAATAPSPEEDASSDAGDTDRLDPHALCVLVSTEAGRAQDPHIYLPLLGFGYRTENMYKPEYPPSYTNFLDIPAYLDRHLADYRAGWADFQETAGRGAEDLLFDYFNVLDEGCECDLKVAAYLGHWLWQRARGDAVREHGGTVEDYRVTIMWGPADADRVLAIAPYADPAWQLPPDHPLAQCPGQEMLFPHPGGHR